MQGLAARLRAFSPSPRDRQGTQAGDAAPGAHAATQGVEAPSLTKAESRLLAKFRKESATALEIRDDSGALGALHAAWMTIADLTSDRAEIQEAIGQSIQAACQRWPQGSEAAKLLGNLGQLLENHPRFTLSLVDHRCISELNELFTEQLRYPSPQSKPYQFPFSKTRPIVEYATKLCAVLPPESRESLELELVQVVLLACENEKSFNPKVAEQCLAAIFQVKQARVQISLLIDLSAALAKHDPAFESDGSPTMMRCLQGIADCAPRLNASDAAYFCRRLSDQKLPTAYARWVRGSMQLAMAALMKLTPNADQSFPVLSRG